MTTSHAHEARVFTGRPADDRAARRRRRRTIDAVAATAATLTGVYEAERFASSLLGQIWESRGLVPALDGISADVVMYGPIVEDLVAHGSSGAALTAHCIGRLVGGGVARLCDPLGEEVRAALPAWAHDVGRSKVIAASARRSPGAGEAILLEVRGAGMIDHAVAVFVDERLGAIAKILGLLHPKAARPGDGCLDAVSADPRDACVRVRAAIARTDETPGAPLDERFAELRAIADARARSLAPPVVTDPSLN